MASRALVALLLVGCASAAFAAKPANYGSDSGYDSSSGYGSEDPTTITSGPIVVSAEIEFDTGAGECPDKFKMDHIRSFVNQAAEELLVGVADLDRVPSVKSGVLDCVAETAISNTTITDILKIKVPPADRENVVDFIDSLTGQNLCDLDLMEDCAEYDIFSITVELLTKVPKGVHLKGTSPEYSKYLSGRYGSSDGAYTGGSGSPKAGKGPKGGDYGSDSYNGTSTYGAKARAAARARASTRSRTTVRSSLRSKQA